MKYIKDKLSNINGELGFLFANEFNSLKNELANVVKYRYALDDNDANQLLRAIITESKMLHYVDSGTVNKVVLTRDGETTFKLFDNQVFFFTPTESNTSNVTVKVGANDEKALLLDGSVLEPGYLDTKVTYMATYSAGSDTFNIKLFNGGASSDFVFSEMHSNSTFMPINTNELGTDLVNNDVVFIDQNTDKYERAIYEVPNTQRQNAIGIYKRIDGKDYVFFSGVVPDFRPDLKSGMKYYLSNTDLGNIGTDNKNIYLGRALKDNKFILDISGDVGIDADIPPVNVWDTHVVDPETKEGNTFTNPDKTLTLMFNKVTYDLTTPTVIMFASVGSAVSKIDFASEYTGDNFEIEFEGGRYGGVFAENEAFDNPIVLELVGPGEEPVEPVTDNTPNAFSFSPISDAELDASVESEQVTLSGFDDGTSISVTGGEYQLDNGSWNTGPSTINSSTQVKLRVNTSTDYSINTAVSLTVGTVTKQFIVTTKPDTVIPVDTTYDTNVVHPVSSEGVAFTDPTETMTLMFDKVSYDGSQPPVIMFASVNGTTIKVDYASEYAGNAFEIEVGGTRFISTFTENEDYSNPITVNQK